MKTIRAAIKLCLFFCFTLGLYGLFLIARPFIPNKVHWRQTIFHLWTKSFVWLTGMKIEVVGTPPKPPFFLVCNHLSYSDIGAIRQAAKGIFVAKGEVEGWFLAGRIVRDMGTIFINRQNRRDIPRAGEEIVKRLDAGEGVIVFPEGTSTGGETVLPFNSSFLEFAARGGVPVSYVSLTYKAPPGVDTAHVVCWGDEVSFFSHLWELLKIREYTAVMIFGEEPIISADRKALAAELHRRVTDTFEPVLQ